MDVETTAMPGRGAGTGLRHLATGLAVAGAVGVGLAVGAALLGWPGLGLSRRGWVLTASTGFVLLGVLSAVVVRRLSAALIVVGLVHCWAGDFLGPIDFTLGGVSFLVGHLWFVGAFTARGVARGRSLAAAGALAVSGAVLCAWLLPHLRRADLPLVLGYLTVISLMVAAAAGTRVAGWRLALTGAGLFYVSDIVVADWRYVHSGWPHDWLCYPLYYTACVVLALWPLLAAGGAAVAGAAEAREAPRQGRPASPDGGDDARRPAD